MKTTDTHQLTARHLCGFTVHPGTRDEYVELARSAISAKQPCTVLYHNLHSLYCWFRSETLRRHYHGATVLVDGMPLIGLLRAAGIPSSRDQRVTYVDLIIPLLTMARDNGYRVYHVGQSGDVQDKALQIVRETVPGIEIRGHDGYFDQSENSADSDRVITDMNDFGSDLVLVGFGTPRQEAWLHAHRDRINAPAVYACGACMEYVAGAVATPPRWMGRMGLEWSFRLLENPRRFAFRYIAEPILLAGYLVRGWVSSKRKSATVES